MQNKLEQKIYWIQVQFSMLFGLKMPYFISRIADMLKDKGHIETARFCVIGAFLNRNPCKVTILDLSGTACIYGMICVCNNNIYIWNQRIVYSVSASSSRSTHDVIETSIFIFRLRHTVSFCYRLYRKFMYVIYTRIYTTVFFFYILYASFVFLLICAFVRSYKAQSRAVQWHWRRSLTPRLSI